MKLTILLLTVAFLQVQAIGLSQKITFTGRDVPLEKLFAVIEQQTGYTIFANKGLLENTRAVSITAKDMPLTEFMNLTLKDQPLQFMIADNTVVLSRRSGGLGLDLKSTAGVLLPPGDIQGRVTNENGEPMAGANVTIRGTNQGSTTDDKGYYKIENVAAGECTLVVSFVGYATKTAAVKVSESGVITLNFTLVASLINLDNLTITSTLSTRKIRAVPTTMAVIEQKDLKNRNLNNITNVLEAIPGIIVQPGNEEFNAGLNLRHPYGLLIRGGAGFGVGIKYIIDGVEIADPLLGSLSVLQTMDPNKIEKIEVLKGPMASTLYGSGAGGGVISITTKKGKSGKTKVNFKTMFTDRSNDYADYKGYQQDYSLNVSGGNEQLNYLLGVGYNLYPTTKLTDINNGIDDKTWSYSARIGGKFNGITADLSLQYGNEKSGVGSTDISYNRYRASIGLPTYGVYTLNDTRNFLRSFLTSLHLKHAIADNWYQDLTVGYNIMNNGQHSYTKQYDETYQNYEFLSSKFNAKYFMFYERPWSAVLKTSITAGFEYTGYETHAMVLNSTTPLTNFFTVSTPAIAGAASFTKSPNSSTGYFAEAVTGWKNNLFLTTGIRFDANKAYGDNVGAYPQPRVGLSYVMEPGKFKIKPRIVWGVASNAPDPTYKTTYTQLTSYGNFVNIGNPDIKPQRSEGYEFGADLFYRSNYSLNVTYYDQKIKDMIQSSLTYDLTTTPTTYNLYYYNIGELINRGLEVSAKALLDPFIVDMSYTQTTSKFGDITGQTPTATVYPGAPLSNIPKRSFFGRLSYSLPSFLSLTDKGGSISLDWKYIGSFYDYNIINYSLDQQKYMADPANNPFPNLDDYYIWQKGYSYFNLRADYSVTKYAVLYVDVQNLLDKQGSLNGQSLSKFPGRRFNFGLNINF